MSKNPAHPTADPTAPGGMSRKALVAEMADRHNYDEATAKGMRWPAQIDAVIQGRLDEDKAKREAEVIEMPDDGTDWADVSQRPTGTEKQPLFIGMPDTRDFIFSGHSGASPSGAERWMNCTASLAATRQFLETLTPNQKQEFAKSSAAARQGTTAHSAAEVEVRHMLGDLSDAERDLTLLELAVEPEDGEAYDLEMGGHISQYVDLLKQYHVDGHELLIEQRVSAAVPIVNARGEDDVHEITGSVDCGVLPTEEDPVLVVVDYKHGDGVDVDVDSNPQVRIYGLGLLGELADEDGNLPGIDKIVYHIVQPRLGGIKTWEESVDDLLQWRDEVLSPALSAALIGPDGVDSETRATYAPSDSTCQWCPAKGACAALADQRVSAAADLFDVVVEAEYNDGPGAFPETGSLSDADLGKLLTQINGLVKIKDDLKAEAQRRLFRGTPVPGFALVNYQPPRKWAANAAEVLDAEGSERLWKKSLLTPTQALAVLKASGEDPDSLDDLIETPNRVPVVAPEGDRRSKWSGVPPEQMFADETDTEIGD